MCSTNVKGEFKIQNYYSIGEAANAVQITSETLRHYDRIGLIKPSKKDACTNYRYYTDQDLVRLNTVRALQQMDLPLQKIKEVLAYDDFAKIIDFLTAAEQKADEKIVSLQQSKAKIQLAKSTYQKQLCGQNFTEEIRICHFPKRVIMLSDTLETPTLDNLWSYLSHFYNQIEPSQKEQFAFEDLAGIYTENGLSRLFAVCVRYAEIGGLRILPEGNYLCADCTEENRAGKLGELIRIATDAHHTQPTFTIQQVVLSGILQWNYQVQVYLGDTANLCRR